MPSGVLAIIPSVTKEAIAKIRPCCRLGLNRFTDGGKRNHLSGRI